MKNLAHASLILALATLIVAPSQAQVPPQITTPDRLGSRIGVLQFRDGVPSAETADKVYDYLDFSRGVESFLSGFSRVSGGAIHKGRKDAGVDDSDVLLFSTLMDSKSRFMTANCDTI